MFDKEVIKEKKKKIFRNSNKSVNFDEVIASYTVKEGFYVFRVDDDAFFFTENTLMDCCPGYFLL